MIVHPASNSILLKLRTDKFDTLRKIFPKHSKEVDHQGHNLALKYNLETVKVLRNMGIKAPSPIRYDYKWPRPANFDAVFDHQYATSDFLTLHNRCFVLNQMGTGKSASVLWAADYLMSLGKIKRALIVAPLSTLEMVWLNEIFSVCMHRTASILHGSADRRRKLLAHETDFYIINHDGLQILAKEIIARKDIDLVVVDEASAYRNAGTNRYEILKKTVEKKKLWLMTGTPCPNAPTDAWALTRLVDPTRVPPYFTQFKRATMNQVSTYKWVPKPDSFETAFNAMQPAIRFKKSECIDLPPVTFVNRKCDLSDAQTKAYQAMKTHLVASHGTETVSAVNAADKINKLRQILCGAVKQPDTGEYIVLPHEPRLKVLIEAIEQAQAKVLIILPFKGIIKPIYDEVNAYHAAEKDGRRCEIVNGDVSRTERTKIFQAFRDDPSLTELICHPKVMAHGLNMTEADMVVFYAPIYSNEESEQVMDRINRPGQKRKMTILRIVANALEQGIYSMVEGKRMSQENILSLFKRELQL